MLAILTKQHDTLKMKRDAYQLIMKASLPPQAGRACALQFLLQKPSRRPFLAADQKDRVSLKKCSQNDQNRSTLSNITRDRRGSLAKFWACIILYSVVLAWSDMMWYVTDVVCSTAQLVNESEWRPVKRMKHGIWVIWRAALCCAVLRCTSFTAGRAGPPVRKLRLDGLAMLCSSAPARRADV